MNTERNDQTKAIYKRKAYYLWLEFQKLILYEIPKEIVFLQTPNRKKITYLWRW